MKSATAITYRWINDQILRWALRDYDVQEMSADVAQRVLDIRDPGHVLLLDCRQFDHLETPVD